MSANSAGNWCCFIDQNNCWIFYAFSYLILSYRMLGTNDHNRGTNHNHRGKYYLCLLITYYLNSFHSCSTSQLLNNHVSYHCQPIVLVTNVVLLIRTTSNKSVSYLIFSSLISSYLLLGANDNNGGTNHNHRGKYYLYILIIYNLDPFHSWSTSHLLRIIMSYHCQPTVQVTNIVILIRKISE